MKERSAGPWTLESTSQYGWKGLSVRAADGTFVANMVMQPFDDNERENGTFIVRAANAYDDLVAALRDIAIAFDLAIAHGQINGGTENSAIATRAAAALVKARR